MQYVHDVRAVPADAEAARWFQFVVRPLLCPPSAVGAALAGADGDDARRYRQATRRARPSGCFASLEVLDGLGCPLSPVEIAIARRMRDEGVL